MAFDSSWALATVRKYHSTISSRSSKPHVLLSWFGDGQWLREAAGQVVQHRGPRRSRRDAGHRRRPGSAVFYLTWFGRVYELRRGMVLDFLSVISLSVYLLASVTPVSSLAGHEEKLKRSKIDEGRRRTRAQLSYVL